MRGDNARIQSSYLSAPARWRRNSDAPMLAPTGSKFHGSVPQDRVADFMARARLLLVPSLWPETVPGVAVHALYAGLPAMGSRIGGIPEHIIEGKTGFLLPPGDVEAWRRAIEHALQNPATARCDERRGSTAGAALRRRSRRCAIRAVHEDFEFKERNDGLTRMEFPVNGRFLTQQPPACNAMRRACWMPWTIC